MKERLDPKVSPNEFTTEQTDAKLRIAVASRWHLGTLGEHAVTVSVT
jgi:hypothetical protein